MSKLLVLMRGEGDARERTRVYEDVVDLDSAGSFLVIHFSDGGLQGVHEDLIEVFSKSGD